MCTPHSAVRCISLRLTALGHLGATPYTSTSAMVSALASTNLAGPCVGASPAGQSCAQQLCVDPPARPSGEAEPIRTLEPASLLKHITSLDSSVLCEIEIN